ncbi:MAG: Mov34/MPN/PAD-1 family protein, partial [Halobellus sp.]|uniref:Mov34/MPN/PAD-1 family protein n=1 Tax=Halobellus sp. TaxID=1979212 RepID=UPI0035D43CDF
SETHPDEYIGFLRGEPASNFDLDRSGTLITEVLIVPGTRSDPKSATVDSNMIPNDRHSVGSIHSHPNGVLRPSDADLDTFGQGRVHIILGHPYGPTDWQAFDQQGDTRKLDVIDVDLPDPEEFFDFTEDDLDIDYTQTGEYSDGGGWFR